MSNTSFLLSLIAAFGRCKCRRCRGPARQSPVIRGGNQIRGSTTTLLHGRSRDLHTLHLCTPKLQQRPLPEDSCSLYKWYNNEFAKRIENLRRYHQPIPKPHHQQRRILYIDNCPCSASRPLHINSYSSFSTSRSRGCHSSTHPKGSESYSGTYTPALPSHTYSTWIAVNGSRWGAFHLPAD